MLTANQSTNKDSLMNDQALIIINPACHQGRGWKRWLSIKEAVLQSFPCPVNEYVLEKSVEIGTVIRSVLRPEKNNFIVSAGGDGSIHYLINALLKDGAYNLDKVILGAIGLGSSNDFLKPFHQKLKDIPVRINCRGSYKEHDAGLAKYIDSANRTREKYFIVNASVGLTASANHRFNNPGKTLQFLKSNFTSGAITYTAISTLLQYSNIRCRVAFDSTDTEFDVSNINLLKIPFVAGSFWYNQGISVDDGMFGLNICSGMNKKKLLHTLFKLGSGKFDPGKNKISVLTDSLKISPGKPIILECDGETEEVSDIQFSVLPRALKILSS